MSKPNSRPGNELRVKLVDYNDFDGADPKNVSSFFRDIGALNSMFKKRIAQLESLHFCSPLGKAAEEYLHNQNALEQKYGVKLADLYVTETAIGLTTPLENASVPTASSTLGIPVSKSVASNSLPISVSPNNGFGSQLLPEINKKRKAEDDSIPTKSLLSQSSEIPTISVSSFGKPLAKSTEPPRITTAVAVEISKGEENTVGTDGKSNLFSGFNVEKRDKQPGSVFASMFAPGFAGGQPVVSASTTTKNLEGFGLLNPSKLDKTVEHQTESSQDGSVGKPNWQFSFGNAAPVSLGGFKFGSLSSNTTQLPKEAAGDEEDGEQDDGVDAVPDIPAVVDEEVPEPDAIISRKCRLFYLDEKAYKPRGTGTAHLKSMGEGNLQLLIRTATSLGVIILNARINNKTVFNKGEGDKKNTITILSLPEPHFKGADPKKFYQFLLKFKDETVSGEFYSKVQQLLKP